MWQVLLPKYVVVVNPRIVCLYWVLFLFLLVSIICRFVAYRQHLSFISIADHIHPSAWVNHPSDWDFAQASQEFNSTEVCVNPGKYTYWFDSRWRYVSDGCVDVCGTVHAQGELLDPNCVSRASAVYMREKEADVFLATWQSFTHVKHGSLPAVKREFVPIPKTLSIGLAYNIAVPLFTMGWPWAIWVDTGETSNVMGSQVNVVTHLVGPDDIIIRTFDPGAELILSLKEIRDVVGLDDLDAPDKYKQPNQMPGDKLENQTWPSYRVSGCLIVGTLKCYDEPVNSPYQGQHEWTEKSKGACYVKLALVQGRFGEFEETHIIGLDESVRVHMTGIRIKFITEGSFTRMDWNALIELLVSLIVLLELPRTAMYFFLTMALGPISIIYTRVLCNDFSVATTLTGALTRLIADYEVFSDKLYDPNRHEDNDNREGRKIMTKDTLNQKLELVFETKKDSIDSDDFTKKIGCLSTFVHKHVVQDKDEPMSICTTVCQVIRELMSLRCKRFCGSQRKRRPSDGSAGSSGEVDDITVDRWCNTFGNDEPITLDIIVELLRRDRHKGCFERIFIPRELKKLMKSCKKACDSDSAISSTATTPYMPT